MTHGEPLFDQSTPTVEDESSGKRGPTPQVATANVDPTAQEEKARVFDGVEQVMLGDTQIRTLTFRRPLRRSRSMSHLTVVDSVIPSQHSVTP
jgi:hypothetical protein